MSNIVINVKPQNSKVNVSNYNSHYVSKAAFDQMIEEIDSKYLTKDAAKELYGITKVSELDNDMNYISYNEDGYFELIK